jgi:hypothetical protein
VARRAAVHHDDRILCVPDLRQDVAEDLALQRVGVRVELAHERNEEAVVTDFFEGYVGWDADVAGQWSVRRPQSTPHSGSLGSLTQAVNEAALLPRKLAIAHSRLFLAPGTIKHAINLARRRARVLQYGRSAADLLRHLMVVAVARSAPILSPILQPWYPLLSPPFFLVLRIVQWVNSLKLPLPERMVQYRMTPLGLHARISYDMHDRHEFRIRTRDTAQSARLAGAKGGHQRGGAVDARIPVGGVRCDQLVGRAVPFQRLRRGGEDEI